MTREIDKAEAKRLLDITDENNQFDGIARPQMMLKQSRYFAYEEIDQATTICITDDGYRVVLHAAVDGRIASWYVDTELNPYRNEED
jgi:hypothetical protein